MPLSPPVVFLNGTWQDNFSQLKSMDLTEYGFQVTSGINSTWIDSDPDNINGSDQIIAVGNLASTGFGSAVVLMGYFYASLVTYSNDPESPTYNSMFSSRINLAASSGMSLAIIAYYSPTSTTDNRIKFTLYQMSPQPLETFGFKFNEVRIINGGIVSNTERWAISIARNSSYAPTVAAYNSNSSRRYTQTATAGSELILSNNIPNATYGAFEYNTPGESVLIQADSGIPAYYLSSSQIPGMPPFVIWDGKVFACIGGGVYIELGSAFI